VREEGKWDVLEVVVGGKGERGGDIRIDIYRGESDRKLVE
jgi:hypothetical protein